MSEKVPPAPESYSRSVIQQAFNILARLSDRVTQPVGSIQMVDATTNAIKLLKIDNGVVVVEDP